MGNQKPNRSPSRCARGTVGADALRMRFANGRAAIEWTSSFAPTSPGPLVNNHGEVGVPQWHKRDPVTQTKFRSEMMRKNSGWYHNPAEDKPVGVVLGLNITDPVV